MKRIYSYSFSVLALSIGLLIFMFSEAHHAYIERTIHLSIPENQPLRLYFLYRIYINGFVKLLEIPGEVNFVIIGSDLLEGGVLYCGLVKIFKSLKT